ncbi:MAG TPA: hypothetical protein VHS31_05040 [Tepidisphaeraceae bacterium]|nr:hypothetical protein [Tepidisphaeraceae bacterium]
MLLAEPISEETDEKDSEFDPPYHTDDQDGSGDGDSNDPSKWITVATFWQPTEAHIARLKLESEEIDCILIDENLVATDWLYANAVGGIKLRVPESEAHRARLLLVREARTDVPGSSDIRSFRKLSFLLLVAIVTGLLTALLIL